MMRKTMAAMTISSGAGGGGRRRRRTSPWHEGTGSFVSQRIINPRDPNIQIILALGLN